MPDMGAVGVLFGPRLLFSWGGVFFETVGFDLAMQPRMNLNCCPTPKCVNEL